MSDCLITNIPLNGLLELVSSLYHTRTLHAAPKHRLTGLDTSTHSYSGEASRTISANLGHLTH
jgi:hypothetical protein